MKRTDAVRAREAWAELWHGGRRILDVVPQGRHIWSIVMGPPTPHRWSDRQGQVACFIACGFSSKDLAGRIGVAESTVATYLAGALGRIGLRDRYALQCVLPKYLRPDNPWFSLHNWTMPYPDHVEFAYTERRGVGTLRFFNVWVDEPPFLTAAEKALLAWLLRGYPKEDLVRFRGTSPRTIANQLSSLFRKLRVPGRHDLDPGLLFAL